MDELMSDPAQPFAASQDADHSQKGSVWNTKKFREEYDAAKARLTDQNFDLTRYADPLSTRRPAGIQNNATAQTQTSEKEKRLQDLIANIKGSSHATA